jgi:hypothetical protein
MHAELQIGRRVFSDHQLLDSEVISRRVDDLLPLRLENPDRRLDPILLGLGFGGLAVD